MEIPKGCPLVYVSFSAEIIPNTIEKLLAVMADCTNAEVKQVCLLLSSPGGNVREGMHLYNVLKGMPFELVTHNTGSVDSIGNAVFLAGSKRYATQHSTFMFHGLSFNAQNQRFEQRTIEERLGAMLSDQQKIADVISKRTTLLDAEILDLFRQAQTKDVQFAVEKGIVHEVRDVKITPGSPMISLVFDRK